MHRVELKVFLYTFPRLELLQFLMHRVELKVPLNYGRMIYSKPWFLMHRVELKARICANFNGYSSLQVPNAPCGVERRLTRPSGHQTVWFLMHRVELKDILICRTRLDGRRS